MKNIYKNVIVIVSSKIQGCRLNKKRLSIEDVTLYYHLTINGNTFALITAADVRSSTYHKKKQY
jgi:hypothetical protein